MKTSKLNAALATLVALLAGCASAPPTSVYQPASIRPLAVNVPAQQNGAIYHPNYNRLVLFEDRRARNIGDTLVILLEESLSASSSANSTASRKAGTAAAVPTLTGLPGKGLQGASLSATSNISNEGKGTTAASNAFSGSISVTVVDVLANGNLIVSGEKQLNINHEQTFVRFSGVVNPAFVASGNTVSSTRVADARIEQRGNGDNDAVQKMGWLSRFFLSVLPF